VVALSTDPANGFKARGGLFFLPLPTWQVTGTTKNNKAICLTDGITPKLIPLLWRLQRAEGRRDVPRLVVQGFYR